MADAKLDPGFEEVALDDGFEEVPVEAAKDPRSMTPEEIAEADRQHQLVEGAKEWSAFGSGAAQGSTFGFSDELGAGADVVSDYISGNPAAKKWREYQKSREAANKALQEESPMAYMGGELAGGIASAAVTPGIGGAKVASMGGRLLGPGMEALLAGKTASTAANIGGKGLAMGLEGLPIGAAYGVGASENDMSNPIELGKDMVSGATMGLITGGALGTAGQTGKEALKGAKNFANDSDFLRQLGSAYEYGKKGLNLGSSETIDKVSLIPGRRAEDLVSRIGTVDEMLGKQVGQSLDNAQQAGVKINIDPSLQETGQQIFKTLFIDNPTLGQILDPKSTKLLKTIAQREIGDLSPVEARALKDELYNLSDKLAGFNSDQANFAKGVGMNLAKNLDMSLKSAIPEYKLAAKHFEEFRRLVPETIISKGTPSQYGKAYMGNLKNPELKLYESSKDMLKSAKLPGESSSSGRATFEQLRKNLQELQRLNPKATEAMGGTAETVTNKLKKQSDELAMLRQATGFDPQEGPTGLFKGAVSGLATTGRGLSTSAANKVGLVAQGVKTAGQSGPVKAAGKLFNATQDQLMNIAQKLKASKATSQVGDSLERALQGKNETAKNAVLFKLMQNPDYRNLLRDDNDGEDN